MSTELIIDGYNLIRCSLRMSLLEQQALERGRGALIEKLSRYRRIKGHPITVVFDGHCSGNPLESHRCEKGVKLIYSREGEQADEVIKRLARSLKDQAIVVTSDQELAQFAQKAGSITIDSQEFEQRLEMVSPLIYKGEREREEDLPDRKLFSTKKKGPARRPPRTRRKALQRLKKI